MLVSKNVFNGVELPAGKAGELLAGALELSGFAQGADSASAKCNFELRVDGLQIDKGDWALERFSADAFGASLSWLHKGSSLRWDCRWLVSSRADVLQLRSRLTNEGASSLLLNRCLPSFVFPAARVEAYFQSNFWRREGQGAWTELRAGCLRLESAKGRSTDGCSPCIALRRVGETSGWAFHVVPSGDWTISLKAVSNADRLPTAVLSLGLSDDGLALPLAPGESFALPDLLAQPLPEGEPHLAAPALHRFLLEGPLSGSVRETPLVYNTWFDQFEVLDLARLRRQLSAAKDAGFEVFVVDAGWYGATQGLDWFMQAGDWREKPGAAFDGRMKEFADEVRAAGLGFGLWMEAERFGAGVPVRLEHPEWFVAADGGMARMDLENDEAFAWLKAEISRLVESYKLAWMKIDFNFSFRDDPRRKAHHGYWERLRLLLSQVKAEHPGLFLEGCASGGLRVDIAAASLFDVCFLSDSADPVDMVKISQGTWLRLPPGRIGRWAVARSVGRNVPKYGRSLKDAPEAIVTPCGAVWAPSATNELSFALLACMTGALGFSGDLAGLSPEALADLRAHVSFQKRWRGVVANSVAHLLSAPQPLESRDGWAAVQLSSLDGARHLLFVYKTGNAGEQPVWRLRELAPAARYRVRQGVDESGESETHSGEELALRGVRANFASPEAQRVSQAAVLSFARE